VVVTRAMADSGVRVSVGQLIIVEFPPRSDRWLASYAPEVIAPLDIPKLADALERLDARWYFRAVAPGTATLLFQERITPGKRHQQLPPLPMRQIEYRVEVVP
jgi:hypothetical protein